MSARSARSIAVRSVSIHPRAAATAARHSSSMASIGAGAAAAGIVPGGEGGDGIESS